MPRNTDMDNVDALFTKEMIEEIDASTEAVEYDELGNPITQGTGGVFAGTEEDDLIAMDDISLDDLFDASIEDMDFDDVVSGNADANSPYGGVDVGDVSGTGDAADIIGSSPSVMESGIEDGMATPDDPGDMAPPILGKKDKRTARSQAHAKKKAEQEAKRASATPIRESGLGSADIMESSVGEADDSTAGAGGTAGGFGATTGTLASASMMTDDSGANVATEKIIETVLPARDATPKGKIKKTKAPRPAINIEVESSVVLSPPDDEDGGRGVPSPASAGGYADLPDDDSIETASESYDEEEYEQVDLPDWADSIRRKVNANVAHAFLLNGNVRDYMVRNITIKDGIVAVLDGECENFDIIAEYDQAHGLSFYGEDIPTREGGDRSLADAYREVFIKEMQAAQARMSIPVTEDIPNRDPVTLFTIISDMFERPSETREAKILLFIDYSDLLVPDASSAQMKPDERKLAITLADIGRSQLADDAGNVMIFITDDMTQLSTRIRSAESRIEQVKIPIPDREERADFIDNVLDVPENVLSDGTQVFEHEESISKEAFAINSAGLSRIQIEDIMLRALSEDTPLTMQLMKERKQEIIREDYDDVLEIIDPKSGFERVGGMEQMKAFFQEEIIEPVHAGEREAVPMGTLLMAPPGTGKSITHSSKIYKKNGPVPAHTIAVGDSIYARDGELHTVLGVFPQGKLPVYEVVLSDGRRVTCSEDHIWTVFYKTHGKYKEKNLTVREMLDKGVLEITPADVRTCRNGHARFHVPQCLPVQYPEREYSVPPYVMGAFLGDGSGTSSCFEMTCALEDEDLIHQVALELGCCYKQDRHDPSSIHWNFIPCDKNTEKLPCDQPSSVFGRKIQTKELFAEYPEVCDYAQNKKIPEEYKYGSVEQRYALLQGLMDTDGSINQGTDQKRYNVRFSSVSEQLIKDVVEIANSLGISCSIRKSLRRGMLIAGTVERYGKEYFHQHDLYNVHFNLSNEDKHKLFRMKRKHDTAMQAAAHHKTRHYEHISICEINKLDREEEMVCFLVDSPDHTFLVEDYVVTHNTMFSKAVAKEAGMNFVALNLNRIMEKWVGSTERNLDRALDCALAMAPTIIFIDEIDEALPNRADPNASSVNKRINQRLLTFFSDTSHRGEVIILAATNYPEKIDPAFKRAGRFDMRVPMFAPNEFDRMRIMRAIAYGRGYEFSWFEDPDKLMDNPFRRLSTWIREGNGVDTNNKDTFFGDMEVYSYTVSKSNGEEERYDVYLPVRLIRIIDKERITLQQFYEAARMLFTDIPVRTADAASGLIETDEVFEQQIFQYLQTREDVLGNDPKNIEKVHKRLWRWEKIYSTFVDQTFRMTGAELDVVMNKAINLFKKWKRKVGDKQVEALIERGILKHDKDIPWTPFLYDACKKTVNAVAGIKQMEDMALLNTSDTDFIPDALYIKTDDGRLVSYKDRHEELSLAQTKATL